MPKRSNKRKPDSDKKKPLGYKRTKDGVDMVFSNTDFIHPKDMTVELMRDRGLNAVEGLRDALYDMTDPQVPKAVRQEINELIKFTLGYIDGVRMNLERVKFPDDMPLVKFEDGQIKFEEDE